MNNYIQTIQRQISMQKQRVKILPTPKISNILQNNTNYENSFTFNKNEYPFINDPKKTVNSFKTMVNGSVIADKLQKIISISHPNIIKLQKIAKGSPKILPGRGAQTYYYLYYEVVYYSLKNIALSSKKQASMLPHMTSLDICQKLSGVVQYLLNENIFFCLQLDDIGVTENGEIKIYISPHVIINSDDKKPDRKEMMKSVDKIMGWWGTTISNKQNTANQKNDPQGLTNSVGFTINESSTAIDQNNNASSFIDRRRQSFQQTQVVEKTGFLSKSQTINKGVLTTEKMKKLDQQIKLIRLILKEKVKSRVCKQTDEVIVKQLKDVNKPKYLANNFQNLQLKTVQLIEQSQKKQSIQQNINTINIYNHTPPHPNDQFLNIQRKNITMQTKPMYSYKINPNNQPPEHIVPNHNYPDDDLYHQQEANVSIDTYQMDIGGDFQPIVVINSNKKIPIVDRQRQKSERNYKNKKQDGMRKRERKSSNHVANKSITSSAGPMQFKNFLVKFIKPQFLAKKSNIYQDPDQDQSQTSKSASKKMQVHYRQLNDAGKSATSHTHRSSSVGRQKIQNQQQQFNYKYQATPQSKNQRNREDNMKNACVITSNQLTVPFQEKFIKNQRSEAIIGCRRIQDLEIGQKIKQALQKTKNAIALLSKVRLERGLKSQERKKSFH